MPHMSSFYQEIYLQMLCIDAKLLSTLFPLKVGKRWVRDIGPFVDDQWEEAQQAVPQCSVNVIQRLMQLYVLLRAHFTPARLHKMGILDSPICGKCSRDHRDLIHLTWRCPNL